MNERIPEQLDKILALVDSSHEGEAVVAVRKARQMLSRNGLSFGDLARAALWRYDEQNFPDAISVLLAQRNNLEAQLYQLRQKLDDLGTQQRPNPDRFAAFKRDSAAPATGQARKIVSLYENTQWIRN